MSPRDARAALFKQRLITVEETRREVAEDYGIAVADVEGRTRVPPAPEARREVMTRLWERGLAQAEIGRLLGRHHSTVNDAVRKSFGDTYAELSPGSGRVRKVQEGEAK